MKTRLEVELSNMKQNYEKSLNECTAAYDAIKELKGDLKARDDIICDLEVSNKIATESANKLNKIMNDSRKKYEKEKADLMKEHKIEIKAWKKDLGKANSKHLKLERKFALLEDMTALSPNPTDDQESTLTIQNLNVHTADSLEEVSCSMCSIINPNYVPDYLYGEIINPACRHCKGDLSEDDPFISFPECHIPYYLIGIQRTI